MTPTSTTGPSSPGAKAATTRRRNKALATGGTYAALLRALWGAQQASDRAKSRAANGKHRREFGSYTYADHNYRASREARRQDYEEKGLHLAKACSLLASGELSLKWGWQVEPDKYENLDCWACGGSGNYFRTCRPCEGKGADQCDNCCGSGSIVCLPCVGDGEEGQKCICNGSLFIDCPSCDTTGIDGGTQCPECGGPESFLCDDDCECKGIGVVGEITICKYCRGKGGSHEPCDRCIGTGVFDRQVVPGMAILYVDLPTGQVSFHSITRGEGPDYKGSWDKVEDASRDRIVAAIDQLAEHPSKAKTDGTAA